MKTMRAICPLNALHTRLSGVKKSGATGGLRRPTAVCGLRLKRGRRGHPFSFLRRIKTKTVSFRVDILIDYH